MNHQAPLSRLLPFLLALLPTTFAFSQDDPAPPPTEESEKSDSPEPSEKTPKTIPELTEDSDLVEGLFSLFRDRETGETRLLLREDQLDTDYLYFSYVENGPAASWLTRGSYQTFDAKVFQMRRHFDQIEFVAQNTSYFFDPQKAIHRAADANITPAVFFQTKIESEDEEKGHLLIKASKLFLSEAFHKFTPLPDPDKKPHEAFSLGKLSQEKSKIRSIRNYPANTDLIVEYVFENEKPYVWGSAAITDPRFISVTLQHSILKAPENPMATRFDDPRIGYFMTPVTDLSSTEAVPYRDVIRRWRLEKKDPAAGLSEPVQPIVFWIENTTPRALRPTIEQAALRWNEAFEKAGFHNAIQIRVQPDHADWEAGDLRYNVIRWVSSPEPFYGGYGPSFVDPRTGEVLGADIMLEHSVIGRMIRESQVMEGIAASTGANTSPPRHGHFCSAAHHARQETLFAANALSALGADDEQQRRLLDEFIHFLVLHEIGHTLGLSHNFRSSHLHSLAEIYDPDTTYPIGLYGSVMDYPSIPFKLEEPGKAQYWTTRPGPYDQWAIEYGYSPGLTDPAAEAARLEAILSRSTDPELAFANDADDMRAPGKAIDPRAMVNDMTSDPLGFAIDQIELIHAIQPMLPQRLLEEGKSYQELLNGYHLSLFRYRNAIDAASRFIGGVYVDRAMRGQPGAEQPLTPVSLEDQQRAMRTLAERLFAPDAFHSFYVSAEYLLAQRRGFNHFGSTEDPKLHTHALNLQRRVLDHLLHPRVMARLTDTALYGNHYTVDQLLADLTRAVFEADLANNVNTLRQNLQLEYLDRLLSIVNGSDHDRVAQSMALNRVRWIESQASRQHPRVNLSTQAHREHLLYRIDRALDTHSH